MAFCTNCGGTVNGAFCTQCGKPVSAAGGATPPQASAPQAAAAAASQAPPPYQAAPPYQQQPYQAAPPYQAIPTAAGPRKTSPLVWILVIVVGLFVLGGVAVIGTGLFVAHKVHEAANNPGLAVTRMLAAMNPDVEVLNTNEGAGTITVRDKKTGKVTTMSFDDAKNGRFHFTAQDENGKTATMDIGGSASKLPSWIPDYPGSKPEVAFTASGSDGEGGTFSFKTSDSASKVMQFYQDKFKEMGMKVTNVMTSDQGGMVNGTDDANSHTLNAIISTDSGQTTVAVTYGKK